MTAAGRPQVLVVGAGSIGARHTRNLVAAGASVTVTDPDAGRAQEVAGAAGASAQAFDLDGIGTAGGFDGAVVASPTSHHREQAELLLASVPKLLVEKPLALDAASAAALMADTDRVAVAYNLRFHEPVRRVVDLIASGVVGDVSQRRLWFGQWLPDWRPTVDYRTTYSARSELGGGVLLDVIHELDLLRWLAGDPPAADLRVLGATVSRRGPLEVDVEDTVHALVEDAAGALSTVTLDYLARRYRRGIEVTGAEATVRLDWARQVIEIEDADGVRSEPAATPVDRSYELQSAAFVAWIRGDGPALPVDAARGAAANDLADRIRAASDASSVPPDAP
ncbi:MAG: hypothetical protein JWM89_3944 [Acidimicrobiales bacterium]|nr:hypothetical protein [Acidimicrobiales bacterium]